MENKVKKLGLSQIAAILFALLAVYHLINGLTSLGMMGFINILFMLMWVAGYGLVAFSLFTERRDILLAAGFGILAVVSLFSFFWGFRYGAYHVDDWYSGYRFSLTAMLPALINLAGYVTAFLASLALVTEYVLDLRDICKKLWFLPAALILATLIVSILVQIFYSIGLFSGWWAYGFVYVRFTNIIGRLIVTAAFFLALTWIAHPDGMSEMALAPKKDAEGNVQYDIPGEDAAYIGLFKHTLLLLITFGIWNLIWIYKRTAYLNRVEDEPKQNPLYQLLLCMFVPCYVIYWTYRNAQRLDKYAESKGVKSDIATLCLITSLAGSLIPAILMQEKMNEAYVGKKEFSVDKTQTGLSEKAKTGLVKHTLLYILTFGIWNFIWIYRTTRELNVVNGEENRNPVTKLLLCIFVPFYMIYWYYVSAQRIDKLANARGVKSELATWTLILSVFAPVIPAILMQEKMNKLA